MKKLIVGVVLLGSITAVAASLGSNKNNKSTNAIEKKAEKKTRHCTHTCPFSEV